MGLVSEILELIKKKKRKARRQPTVSAKRSKYYAYREDEHLKSQIKGALKKVGIK